MNLDAYTTNFTQMFTGEFGITERVSTLGSIRSRYDDAFWEFFAEKKRERLVEMSRERSVNTLIAAGFIVLVGLLFI